MEKFDIEKATIQLVARKLSAQEEDRYIGNLAMNIILAYEELLEKTAQKKKENDILSDFKKTPEEYLGVEG